MIKNKTNSNNLEEKEKKDSEYNNNKIFYLFIHVFIVCISQRNNDRKNQPNLF